MIQIIKVFTFNKKNIGKQRTNPKVQLNAINLNFEKKK